MTETIHSTRALESSIKRANKLLILMGALLFVSMIGVPAILRNSPVVVIDEETFFRTVKSKPFDLTVSRIEGFARQYLSNRWEWTAEDFEKKRSALQEFVIPASYGKLKDSLTALESLARTQKARSYFVLEGWGFSNKERKVEARIDRVIRIGSAAVATPLVIRLLYQDAPVTEANPYGLKVESLEELEPQGGGA